MLVTTILAEEVLLTLKSSNVPIPTSAFVMMALVIVPVVMIAFKDVRFPTNSLAVIIPDVLALKLEESVDANETFAVPSKEIELASKSPVIDKFLAVSSLVAVDATPVRSPATFPVTFPVRFPTKDVAVIIPLARMFPSVIPTPIPDSGFNPI